jgi:hypothetical protein
MKQLQAVLVSHSSVGLTEGLQVDESDDESVDMSGWSDDPFSMMTSSPPVAAQQVAPVGRPELSATDKTIILGDGFHDELKDKLAAAVAFAKARADAARDVVKQADAAFDRVDGRLAQLTVEERAVEDLVVRWFGRAWHNGAGDICKVYADISAQVEVDLFKRYGGGGSGKLLEGVVGNTTFAYTAFGAGGAIYLAAKFWDELDATGKGYCVLHEMSHWVNGDVLDVSSGAGGRAAALAVADGGSAHARTNAYCYQFFAESV